MTVLFAETALLPEGWANDVRIALSPRGDIEECQPETDPAGADRVRGVVLPGMPNLHSHAFQRAMAGLAEHAGSEADSFWTWREVMYDFVLRLQPEDLTAIAAQLYVEMAKAGYTAVGEFHYLHNDPAGQPYEDPAVLSEAVIAAAADAGIGITMLPVLYQAGGFGGAAAGPKQRRFLKSVDGLLDIVARVQRRHRDDPHVRVGLAPHSLRAVPPDALSAAVEGLGALDPSAPIHIHIAEQEKEVTECLAWSQRRPVAWLLERQAPDRRWCLVHATHMEPGETRALAATGAVVGLCPTTEANLGDGLFDFTTYRDATGLWGIGSDSHISVSPLEELRWLEYGQRLHHRRRNLAVAPRGGASGRALWCAAVAGGAAALARPIGALAAGKRADLVVLDDQLPTLYGRMEDRLLDSAVFAGNDNPVKDVMIGGRWVVRDGRHRNEDKVLSRYRAAIDRLRG